MVVRLFRLVEELVVLSRQSEIELEELLFACALPVPPRMEEP